MKAVLIVAALAVSLGGCQTLAGGDPTSRLPSQVLNNLQHCKRTYTAAVGGLGIPGGSLFIDCPAMPYEPAPVVVPLRDLGKPGTGTEPVG